MKAVTPQITNPHFSKWPSRVTQTVAFHTVVKLALLRFQDLEMEFYISQLTRKKRQPQ